MLLEDYLCKGEKGLAIKWYVFKSYEENSECNASQS